MTNSCFGTRVGLKLLCAVLIATVVACEEGDDFVYTDLRVYQSPYMGVDWANDVRLKAQHHDHMAGRPARILAYDAAGYDVLSLMEYSGNPKLKFALSFRLWPPEEWVEGWVRERLTNVKLFIPNAEEVGLFRRHITSPFLDTYIEPYDEPSRDTASQWAQLWNTVASKQLWQYSSRAEMFSLIEEKGGMPCFAHPWDYGYDNVRGKYCAEIYNAYGAAQRSWGDKAFVEWDRNEELVKNWDFALQSNQQIYGIAVNDHFGPDSTRVSAQISDSGKIIVVARSASREDYEERFRQGAFFAVKDLGPVKDRYPQVYSIEVTEDSVYVETLGDVKWISKGEVIATGPLLLYTRLPVDARYVRAEISNGDESVVYTQPFVVRPVGDADGDYKVDSSDQALCNSADGATPIVVAACAAAAR